MSSVAIELNDAGVAIAKDGALLRESPGYALVDGDRVLVGTEAQRKARLQPRHVHSEFWERLGSDPLPRPSRLARCQADLARAHLAHLWGPLSEDCDSVIFAVPGSFSRTQLGLLLGIAQSISIPVVGMVDGAVAGIPDFTPKAEGRGSRRAGSDAKLLHIDLQLHRAVVTRLCRAPTLRRTNVDTSSRVGLAVLWDACVALIAEEFVRQTRFDPLYRARTEQQLYDLLPRCLERLRQDTRVAIRMNDGSRSRRIVLRRSQLVEAMSPYTRRLASLVQAARGSDKATTLHLSARAYAVPGLAHALGGVSDSEPVGLEPGASALGALARDRELRSSDGSIRFVSAVGSGRETT